MAHEHPTPPTLDDEEAAWILVSLASEATTTHVPHGDEEEEDTVLRTQDHPRPRQPPPPRASTANGRHRGTFRGNRI